MICFVILHYMIASETLECIKSIKKSFQTDKRIIIVDNASPNDSGEKVKSFYQDDEEVIFIKSQKNEGFAKGNNIGYLYAKKNYNPQFVIIMNNDVEIRDTTFYSKLCKIYETSKFHVLGPDVYSTSYKIHQSPKKLKLYSTSEIERLNKKYLKLLEKQTIIFYIKQLLKRNSILVRIKYQLQRKKTIWSRRYENVILHGACIVFSERFIKNHDFAFYDKTFFYFESEILAYLCDKENLLTVYDPSLKVIHHQNVSTNIAFKSIVDKTLFAYRCNYESTRAFLELIRKSES